MIAVWAPVRPRVFGWFLAFAASGTLLASYAYRAALALG